MAKKRITKVYTRTGDKGETLLVDGSRVSKSSVRVEAYGDVDELNAVVGVAKNSINDGDIVELIKDIQNDLFILGADLATPTGIDAPRINQDMVVKLEENIDRFLLELEPLKEFILPGGSNGGAFLHLARTVSRRAERSIVRLAEKETINGFALSYINRLSDLLFVLARVVNKRDSYQETFVDFGKEKKE